MQKKVLVIDDEKAVRNSFKLALKGTPYEIETASDGRTGLYLFMEKKFDLVYLDLKMPVMSGPEVLIKIREKENIVPVYIVTAFHREFFDELADVRKKGIEFELLMKPIGLDQIREITRGILDGGSIMEGDADV